MRLRLNLLWQSGSNVDPSLTILLAFQKDILLVLMLMPMRLFSIFSMVCSHLYRPGFARSNPRTYRQPCKLPNKLVRRWRLQLLHKVATNHTSIMFPFPLPFPLLLICTRRWCPWSWLARAFLAHATIAARFGIEL